MLSTIPTKKRREGASRVKPSDLPSAAAQTASRNPERTRTTHAMTDSSAGRLVALRVRLPRPVEPAGSGESYESTMGHDQSAQAVIRAGLARIQWDRRSSGESAEQVQL